MGTKKIKPEGGSGGKRGHSNMAHWFYTHEVKEAARVRRRKETVVVIQEQMNDIDEHQPRRPSP